MATAWNSRDNKIPTNVRIPPTLINEAKTRGFSLTDLAIAGFIEGLKKATLQETLGAVQTILYDIEETEKEKISADSHQRIARMLKWIALIQAGHYPDKHDVNVCVHHTPTMDFDTERKQVAIEANAILNAKLEKQSQI